MSPLQHGEHMSIIAEQVRAARNAQGWTQDELAARAGLSRPSIARIERGDDVSTTTMTKVIAALELKISITPDDGVSRS